MKNTKRKFLAFTCGLGLFLGINAANPAYTHNLKKDFHKEGFEITLDYFPDKYYGKSEGNVYLVTLGRSGQKKADGVYDGDIDVEYEYQPVSWMSKLGSIDKNRDGWIRKLHQWKMVKEDVSQDSASKKFESNKKTDSVFNDAYHEEIPGSPKGLPTDCRFSMEIDFDKGEEYAECCFTNEKDALEWADNMIEIFKSKQLVSPYDTEEVYKNFKKEGFNISIRPYSIGKPGSKENSKGCRVWIWNENLASLDMEYTGNGVDYDGNVYDGDVELEYEYMPPSEYNMKIDKNKDGWYREILRWEKTKTGHESSSDTGSEWSDMYYEELPGNPKGLPKDFWFDLRVDFDKGEEFAKCYFTNEKDALEWIDNMIKIFKFKK